MGVRQTETTANKVSENDELSTSEKKRLESLKQKKEAFRAKEQAVRNALRNLDAKANNKIIFDDNFDDASQKKIKKKEKKRKILLDDSDGNEDNNDEFQPNWDKKDFRVKGAEKAYSSQYSFGNDKRFKLDERFADNDDDKNTNNQDDKEKTVTSIRELGDDTDLQKEKEWQLDLLGSVLGVPIASKNKEITTAKKTMIRYDPSEKSHSTYEIVKEETEPLAKKPKKKKKKEQPVEDGNEPETVPEVSKDIFYSVSQNLTKSLAEQGSFSLLGKFKKEDETDEKSDTEKEAYKTVEITKNQKFKFSFDTKNPFKYDSSDGETEEVSSKYVSEEIDIPKEQRRPTTDKFFFEANDVRFDEALKFFSKDALPQQDFKQLRQELKQIMRVKIRNNVQKSQPWGNKKKVKKPPRTSKMTS